MKKKTNKKNKEDLFYCPKCGGCGYIACDGIRDFIEKHVKGKTDCTEEASFIADIIQIIEDSHIYRINHEHES